MNGAKCTMEPSCDVLKLRLLVLETSCAALHRDHAASIDSVTYKGGVLMQPVMTMTQKRVTQL